jgi:hypothetical protein
MIHFAAKLDELVAASRRSYPWFFSSSAGFAIALWDFVSIEHDPYLRLY